MELVQKREFTDEKRQELADKGHAMSDGSFPIENITDLHNAIQSVGRSKNYAAAKKHIIQRAKDLEATNILPEDWKISKFIDDVKDAFEKAIGTSSSVDQERDERSVENYVRQTANTNVIAGQPNDYTIGGNTMSDNTTQSISVTWDGGTPAYDGNTAGTYVFSGILTLPANTTNTSNLTASINIIVAAQSVLSPDLLQTTSPSISDIVQQTASSLLNNVGNSVRDFFNFISSPFKKILHIK